MRVTEPPIVAVGLLCRTELERLGIAFARHIPLPLPGEDPFAGLLQKLDEIEVDPGNAVAILKPPP
jgi:hypothetical protein